jgi:hypothetical protein
VKFTLKMNTFCEQNAEVLVLMQGVYMFLYRILFSGSPSYSYVYLIPLSRYCSATIFTFLLVSLRSIFIVW